ncbi:MAG: hypothetical protein LBU66_06115 [Treponema sp.]|jgi:hypothetical protein|nr:hypothetical protein [Treponema sp.]
MKTKYLTAIFILKTGFFLSCAGQNNSVFIPIPDEDFFKSSQSFEVGIITENREGGAVINLPEWLEVFLDTGIEGVERLDFLNGKFAFIAVTEGVNFLALNKWADNFSAERDFSILAARRIEKRMISASSLYPDDEYGMFYEMMIKNAYSAEYRGAVKEDTYWIKTRVENEETEAFVFFVLLTIEKPAMQSAVFSLMAQSVAPVTPTAVVTPTAAQSSAINRLRQTFFLRF